MRIKIDYEECADCEQNKCCNIFDEMKALVAATVEALRKMTHNDEVQS